MLQAMFNGVSAIKAHQERMDVIGNNIANVNTTAYKAGRVTFQDQLSQTIQGASKGDGENIGGTNPQQTGLGMKVGSIDTLMAQGGLQSTSRPTDLAIQGNGFFMLGTPEGMEYTRDGSFTVDSTGSLVNSSTGQYVLGWQSDPATGHPDTTQEITGNSHLNIPVGSLTSVFPTSDTAYAGNLSAEASSTDPAYTRSVKVYDSLGAAQTIQLGFQRDAALSAGAPTGATSSWTWTASGTGVSAPSGTTNQGTIFFDSGGKEVSSTGAISLTHTDGSSTPQAITPSFTDMTQVSGSSNAAPVSQNGAGPGTLQSFSIDETGTITGIFNNGQTRNLGQIALATFANADGLQRAGSNNYRTSTNTGLPQVGTATQSGLGKISSGYLEQSNVDLSSEFTNMIITQRGFQANTKIVTTVDQMLNELINIKQ